MIFSGVLFARVGGILGLYAMGLPFTISAGVGFVALAGASILEGLILVSSIRDRMARGVPKREAIEQARLTRLRPVLMTGTVAALGFVPMMLATGIGAEVQRPLATVVVFGMACDTFLTILALPVLYLLFGEGPRVEAEVRPAARGDDHRGERGGSSGGTLASRDAGPWLSAISQRPCCCLRASSRSSNEAKKDQVGDRAIDQHSLMLGSGLSG